MSSEVIAAAAIIAIVVTLAIPLGVPAALATGFLLTAFLLPRYLVTGAHVGDAWFTDINESLGPSLTTVGLVAAMGGVIAIAATKGRALGLYGAALVFCIGLSAVLVWPHHTQVLGGTIHLLVGVCAWTLGRWVAQARPKRFAMANLLAVVASASVMVGAMVNLGQLLVGAVDPSGRPDGLYYHPSVYGRVAMLSLLLILPATRSKVKGVRWAAWTGVASAVLGTGLTESRANVVGILLVIGVWLVSLGRRRAGRALLVYLVLGLVLAVAFGPTLVERALRDPGGGDRPALFQAGWRLLGQYALVGTGPNNYVVTGAATEPIVAETGYPVHNTFLAAITELGAITGVLFIGLWVIPTVRSLLGRRLRHDGLAGDYARATISVFIGLLPAMVLGWGFLQHQTLFLMLFLFGYCWHAIGGRQGVSLEVATAGDEPSTPSGRRGNGRS